MMPSRTPRSALLRYGCAALSVALVVLVRLLLEPLLGGQAPLLLFALAVMTSAWYGGLGAGLLATGLGGGLGAYLFIEPAYSFGVSATEDRVVLALFVVVGVMISLLSQALHSSRGRVEEAARELRKSEDSYRRIVETAGEGIWMIDADARTVFVNRRMTEMLGCSREEMLGASSLDHIFAEEREEARRKFEAKRRGDNEPFDFRLRRKDGTEVWARISTSSVFDENGALIGVLGMFRDVTERRKMEEERARLLMSERAARAEAEAANHAKDDFIATVSHELRTPLASMLMWTRMLASRDLDAETTAQAHATLIGNVKMLAQLIDDLLDVSRIITAKLHIDPQPTPLVAIIEAAIGVVRPAADARQITINTAFDSSARIVLGDSNRLQQVFWNLLSNGVKFSREGGVVEVRVEYAASHAHVSVADHGVGINAEFLPRIFERFYQVKEESGRRGLGLGLAIVRHLVEIHGGTIEVASAGEGHGATFTVTLPLMAEKSETGDAARLPPVEESFSPCATALEGVRVMVVDDNEDAREVTTMALEGCGARVERAASCGEAMNLLTAETAPRWDVLIFDLQMPVADGYELIRKVRSLAPERGGQLPAAALTAHAGMTEQNRALAAGFNAHLVKPVEPDELVRTVARLAGRSEETTSVRSKP